MPSLLPHPLGLADMVEALEATDAAAKAARPLGVLPLQAERLGPDPALAGPVPTAPPISLGTRRLCNDRAVQTYGDGILRASIEPQRVVVWHESGHTPKRGAPNPLLQHQVTGRRFNGYMSPQSKRHVRRVVSTWLHAINHYRRHIKRRYDPGRAYPVMLTVTLPSPQVHPDKEITRQCLIPFLQHLRRHHNVEHYFWRAEAQENGNVHYHILADRYIRAEDLQADWLRKVNRLGYVDRYYDQTGEATPPATHIQRIRDKVRDAKTGKWRSVDPVSYLLEYVMAVPEPEPLADGEEPDPNKPRILIGRHRDANGVEHTYTTRAINGRVWGMSDALRVIREPRAEVTVRLTHALSAAVERGTVRRVDTEHATMYFGAVRAAIAGRAPPMWRAIEGYYTRIFGYLYPDQLPEQVLKRVGNPNPVNVYVDLLAGQCVRIDPYTLPVPAHAPPPPKPVAAPRATAPQVVAAIDLFSAA